MEMTAVQKYEEKGRTLLTEAQSIMIVDDTTRELATEFSSATRKAIKIIEEEFKPEIEKAHQLHKGLLDRVKKLTAPFREAQSIVDEEIKRDWLERERARKEEERKVWLEQEAERKRQEVALAAEVADKIDEGDMEMAEALADSEVVIAPVIPVPKVQQTTTSASGSITAKKDISVEVADKMVVVRAVCDGKLPDTLLMVDVGAAKRYAKAAGLTTMPGFCITETAIIAGRAW